WCCWCWLAALVAGVVARRKPGATRHANMVLCGWVAASTAYYFRHVGCVYRARWWHHFGAVTTSGVYFIT
ncbi:hypothetical protein, partial [Frankia sp. CcI156]|uniref:hypothetical protein n=1 Tax=Frankia sp. CcI156 TaxID=1745380 RepID=UPI001C37CC36